jgi:hypothetical protein
MRTFFQCPATAAVVTINLKDDAKSVYRGWRRSLSLKCPHCDETHQVPYRDMYVDGVLSGFQGDFNALIRKTTAQRP